MATISAPTVRSQPQIDAYFGLLMLTYGVVGQLAALPVQFYLKDRLHLGPQTIADFGFLVGIPTYIGFLFGYLRDRWRPRAWGDRAYLLGAGLLSALGYLFVAEGRLTYARLLLALLALTALGQMVGTVIQALTTAVAQRDHTTGHLSMVLMLGLNAPGVVAALAGGWLSEHVSAPLTFLLTGVLAALAALLAFWRPPAVYNDLPDRSQAAHGGTHALARLFRHRPLWPAVLICGLWNFGLCFGTPVQFYLTDHAGLNHEQFGTWSAIFAACFLPTTALYGLVSRRWPLRRSLWVGTVLAVFQVLLFLIMRAPGTAYLAAAAAGLFGGFANGAYWDLLMRSAPKGLEGTAVMLGGSAFALSAAATSLLGAFIYAHGGFALSVWLTAGVYILIFPVLLWVPRTLTATHDEQAPTTPAALEAVGL